MEIKSSSQTYVGLISVVLTRESKGNYLQITPRQKPNTKLDMPSLLHLVIKNSTEFESNCDKTLISVFSSQPYTNILKKMKDWDKFPCGSNIDTISCLFFEGDTVFETQPGYLFSWHRVDILIDPSSLAADFHIVLPVLADQSSQDYQYAALIGAYYSSDRSHVYEYMLFNQLDSAGLLPQQTNQTMLIRGQAGSLSSDVVLNIQTSTSIAGNFDDPSSGFYGAGIFIVAKWELWIQSLSQYTYKNIEPGCEKNINQALGVCYLDRQSEQHCATFIPLCNSNA